MASCKIAKNQGPESLPPNMYLNDNQVTSDKLSDTFAEFFNRKVVGIVESTRVDQGVYNGHQKINAKDWMFMAGERITECIKKLYI